MPGRCCNKRLLARVAGTISKLIDILIAAPTNQGFVSRLDRSFSSKPFEWIDAVAKTTLLTRMAVTCFLKQVEGWQFARWKFASRCNNYQAYRDKCENTWSSHFCRFPDDTNERYVPLNRHTSTGSIDREPTTHRNFVYPEQNRNNRNSRVSTNDSHKRHNRPECRPL